MLYLSNKQQFTIIIQVTLESGINIPPWINVAPGKFGKKNKRSPIYTSYLYYINRLYEVQNKAVAPGKKSKIDKRRGTFSKEIKMILRLFLVIAM